MLSDSSNREVPNVFCIFEDPGGRRAGGVGIREAGGRAARDGVGGPLTFFFLDPFRYLRFFLRGPSSNRKVPKVFCIFEGRVPVQTTHWQIRNAQKPNRFLGGHVCYGFFGGTVQGFRKQRQRGTSILHGYSGGRSKGFASKGPQAIAKYLTYFAFLGSRPGTNHALAEKESSKAKPRFFIYFPRQIEVEPGASGSKL